MNIKKGEWLTSLARRALDMPELVKAKHTEVMDGGRCSATIGVPLLVKEFCDMAAELRHPFECIEGISCDLLHDVIFSTLVLGHEGIAKKRVDQLHSYMGSANALPKEEAA